MALQIIIRKKAKYGRTRVEQEGNLRKDGLRGLSDENFDKAKYLEKKGEIKDGFLRGSFLELMK